MKNIICLAIIHNLWKCNSCPMYSWSSKVKSL